MIKIALTRSRDRGWNGAVKDRDEVKNPKQKLNIGAVQDRDAVKNPKHKLNIGAVQDRDAAQTDQ